MAYRVVDTSEWTAAQLDPYWPEIFAAMMKLKAKLPEDASYCAMLVTWARLQRKLWLVLDDDRFVAFAMTEIETMAATGKKAVTLKDLAGYGALKAAKEICETMEAYAASEGASIGQLVGRDGWRGFAKKFGYEVASVTLRKVVER